MSSLARVHVGIDAVDCTRCLAADQPASDIAPNEAGIALGDRPEPSRARQPEADDVVPLEPPALLRAELARRAVADEERASRRAGLPAEQSVGRKLVTIAEQRHRGGGAQDLHVLADAAAATMPTRAAGIRDQLEAMEQDR